MGSVNFPYGINWPHLYRIRLLTHHVTYNIVFLFVKLQTTVRPSTKRDTYILSYIYLNVVKLGNYLEAWLFIYIQLHRKHGQLCVWIFQKSNNNKLQHNKFDMKFSWRYLTSIPMVLILQMWRTFMNDNIELWHKCHWENYPPNFEMKWILAVIGNHSYSINKIKQYSIVGNEGPAWNIWKRSI